MTHPPSHIPDRTVTAAVAALRGGGVVACPTESVWGLSCDPLDETAVEKVLALKKRGREQGLILVAASVEQLEPYMGELPLERETVVLATWPGPVTWIVPATPAVPPWIMGLHDGVALRVTRHPVTAELCRAFGRPLVSTSANRSGAPPARSEKELREAFPEGIDCVVPGDTGEFTAPTQILDALTGEVLRASP